MTPSKTWACFPGVPPRWAPQNTSRRRARSYSKAGTCRATAAAVCGAGWGSSNPNGKGLAPPASPPALSAGDSHICHLDPFACSHCESSRGRNRDSTKGTTLPSSGHACQTCDS